MVLPDTSALRDYPYLTAMEAIQAMLEERAGEGTKVIEETVALPALWHGARARSLAPVCISICGHAPRSISKSLINTDVY